MNINWQELCVFLIVALAASYLLRFYFKKKNKKSGCAYSECDCKVRKQIPKK